MRVALSLLVLLSLADISLSFSDAEAKDCILRKFDLNRDFCVDEEEIARVYDAILGTALRLIAWTPQQWMAGCSRKPPTRPPRSDTRPRRYRPPPPADDCIDAADLDATLGENGTCWPSASHRYILQTMCERLTAAAFERDI